MLNIKTPVYLESDKAWLEKLPIERSDQGRRLLREEVDPIRKDIELILSSVDPFYWLVLRKNFSKLPAHVGHDGTVRIDTQTGDSVESISTRVRHIYRRRFPQTIVDDRQVAFEADFYHTGEGYRRFSETYRIVDGIARKLYIAEARVIFSDLNDTSLEIYINSDDEIDVHILGWDKEKAVQTVNQLFSNLHIDAANMEKISPEGLNTTTEWRVTCDPDAVFEARKFIRKTILSRSEE